MTQFVVLLRGVNVGKGNKVPMRDFRELLEQLGHENVQTLLNSGNAVFTTGSRSAAKLAQAIAAAVEARFGVTTPVIVKSASELRAIIDTNPIVPPATEHSRFLVAFAMDSAALEALESLRGLLGTGERLAITAQAAYLHCAGGLLESKVAAAMLGRLGRRLTTRNLGTVLKLADLAASGRPDLARIR